MQPKFNTEDHIQKSNPMKAQPCVDEIYDSADDNDIEDSTNSDCERSSIATGLDDQQTNQEIKDNLDTTREEVCITECWISQRQAEDELEVARILEVKRKLKDDEFYNDQPWTMGHEDFLSWIPMIKQHQPQILPLDLIQRKR